MSKRKKPTGKKALRFRQGIFLASAINHRVLLGVLLIVIVTCIAYFPSLGGGYIWDDHDLLTENPLVKSPQGLYQFWFTTKTIDYWPMTNTSFWLEWRLWENKSTGYHVTNLALHIVASLLIWIILRKLSIPGAFFAALIFAVHPVNVESVAWIAQRKNTLAMLFFLLSILWYLKFLELARPRLAATLPTIHRPSPTFSSSILHPSSFHIWYWLSLAAFVLAMLSKGSVAVLPVLLMGIIQWLRPLTRRDLIRISPFFAVAASLAAVNVWFQTHGTEEVIRKADFMERMLGAGGIVWFYLYKALLPLNLSFVYPQWNVQVDNLLWWMPLFSAVALTAVLWRYRNYWSRPFLLAWGFFCLGLAPVMGFTDVFFMRYSLVADHYQYIAIIGVIALAAAGWSVWHGQRREAINWAAGAIAVATVITLVLITNRQSRLYRDDITLYQDTVEKNPNSWLIRNLLGSALLRADRPRDAIEHFRQAMRLKPDEPDGYYKLGKVLIMAGRPREAIEPCEKALRMKPDFPEAHNDLASALIQLGRAKEAIEHCQHALRLKSDYAEAYYNLANAFVLIGEPKKAIEQYQNAVRFKPDYATAYNNLGNLFLQTGQLKEAIERFNQALRLKPDYVNAHFNLAGALVQTGRPGDAIEHYQKVLQLNPNFTSAQFNLALAYAAAHKSAQAVENAQKALGLARVQGQTVLAKEIKDWLDSHR